MLSLELLGCKFYRDGVFKCVRACVCVIVGVRALRCSLKVVAVPQRRVTPVCLRNNPFLHLHIHSLKYTSVGRQRTNKNNKQTANQRERG